VGSGVISRKREYDSRGSVKLKKALVGGGGVLIKRKSICEKQSKAQERLRLG